MVTQPPIAGVPQCVLEWSLGLMARGWDAVVACPSEGPLTQWCLDAGVPVQRWESVRAPRENVRSEITRLREIMAHTAPDVVVLHSSKAGLVGRLSIRGTTPTAFAPHAWSFDAADGATAKAALRWEQFAGARWTDVVLCVSEAERERGLAAGIRANYRVTRNGVDVDALRTIADLGRSRVHTRLPLPSHTKLVVCPGRLTRQKGQSTLLQAWPQVPGGDGRHLALLGGGPDDAELRAIAGGDPTVTFLGAADRAAALAWMAAADLTVAPSRWEGMALVPLESLAVGTPVVATDVTGIREAVTEQVGAVVPVEDPAAMAVGITEWLARTPAQLAVAGAAATDRARSHFSLASTVAAVDSALTECLGRDDSN